jgi:hypothetical protein
MIKNYWPQFLLCWVLGISACSDSTSGSGSGSSNNNQNASADTIVVLPDAVIGQYTGTLLWGSTEPPKVAQNVTATITRDQKLASITFSGPGVDASVPRIQNFQFAVTPGSQVGLYHSVKVDQSQEGIAIATYMTNMNIVDLEVGGVRVEYTGMK